MRSFAISSIRRALLDWHGKTPIVLFTHDVEAEVWDRHRKVARSWIWKIASYLEWKALTREEQRYVTAADHVVAVSERNKESFTRYVYPSAISVIGTLVDSDYFSPAPEADQPGHLVFTGAWIGRQTRTPSIGTRVTFCR
jgi:hypothetical protein